VAATGLAGFAGFGTENRDEMEKWIKTLNRHQVEVTD
jgi:hypothetical protein